MDMAMRPNLEPHRSETRRVRAAIIGFGLDDRDDHHRLTSGTHSLFIGGSAETHAELVETALRLESELERMGRGLGDLPPIELAELAWRIDSPELHRIAVRMDEGLRCRGRSFADSSAEELRELSAWDD